MSVKNIFIVSFLLCVLCACRLFAKTATPPQSAVFFDTSLVLYYPFSGVSNDSSGFNRHLQNTGAVLTAGINGQANTAYYFSGSANMQYTNSQDIGANLFLPVLSVSLWFKAPPDFWAFDPNEGPCLFNISGDWGDNEGVMLYLSKGDTSARVQCNVNTVGRQLKARILLNTWNHVVFLYDGTVMKFYLNGKLADSLSVAGQITYSSAYKTLGVGMWNAVVGYEHYFKGSIDQIRAYKRALSPQEISALYAERNPNIVEKSPDVPAKIEIEGIYPNPFNTECKIYYTVITADDNEPFSRDMPNLAPVSLSVYNILGRKVATLVDEMHWPGRYGISFNGTNYPSGVYICVLRANHAITAKKMILLR